MRIRISSLVLLAGFGLGAGIAGTFACSSGDAAAPPAVDASAADAPIDAPAPPFDAPSGLCGTPGAIVFDERGGHVIPGGDSSWPDLKWLHLPAGFCAHFFAKVPVARTIRFAPGGELFVASPTTSTTGGGTDGLAAIVVVPDDNHDLVGDTPVTYAANLLATQGMLFAQGYFYFQDHTRIMRVPYAAGDRTMNGSPTLVTNISIYTSIVHWPKSIDQADDGTIYVSNGGDQAETCDTSRPFHGGILRLDGDGGAVPVAKGLRNAYAIRCQKGRGRCYATELSKDQSATSGGREKLIPIRDGDDWGFPCCATKGVPYNDVTPTPDCSAIAPESASFVIGNTPFGFDYEPGNFPAPWQRSIFVALHGDFGTWKGAEVIAIGTDPQSGEPLPSSDLDGGPSGALRVFATGWDDGTLSHGRPGEITFGPDGRMYIANDVTGEILWVSTFTR